MYDDHQKEVYARRKGTHRTGNSERGKIGIAARIGAWHSYECPQPVEIRSGSESLAIVRRGSERHHENEKRL